MHDGAPVFGAPSRFRRSVVADGGRDGGVRPSVRRPAYGAGSCTVATFCGFVPTGTVPTTVLDAVEITDTVPSL
jgi:hypothetical protein